jgi:hypothetical protein
MRLPTALTNALYDRAMRIMCSRPADVNIGRDENGNPYMRRWHAIPRNRVFNVYLHGYLHDDDCILHSHPWWSVSLCIMGYLREFYTDAASGANMSECHKVRLIKKGDVVWRSADMFHRLEVGSPGQTVTIFITGPKLKTWYFACKRGLIDWRNFVSSRDKGEVGAGCGEDDAYPTNH